MANPAAITCSITITSKSLAGDSVAKTFSSVLELQFDYFMGKLHIRDAVQGNFWFGLTEVATLTYTVSGTVTTVVAS